MNELLEIAIRASLEAGKRIMEIYENEDLEVQLKGDDSPLTKADTASHKVIKAYLETTGIPVLSEEGRNIPYEERKNWKQLWIVDPIDGTKEFIKKNGEFTINIALVENKRPVMGVIFAPVLGDLYFSEQEVGSFKVTIDIEKFEIERDLLKAQKLPIAASPSHSITASPPHRPFTIVASRSHMSPETEEYVQEMRTKHGEVKLISKGSSLKLCMVAEGQADCYPRFAPTMEWDTAAGQAICEHAGFKVIDWKTKESMLYNREDLLNNWFLVK